LVTPFWWLGPKRALESESDDVDPIGVSTPSCSRVVGMANFPGALSEETLNDVVLEADICQPFLDSETSLRLITCKTGI
jgi:hypothetical protein